MKNKWWIWIIVVIIVLILIFFANFDAITNKKTNMQNEEMLTQNELNDAYKSINEYYSKQIDEKELDLKVNEILSH